MDTQAVSPKSSAPAPEPVAKPVTSVVPTPRAAPAVPSQNELRERMAAVAQQMRDYLRSNGRDLEFRVDADTHDMVITVREAGSARSSTGAKSVLNPRARQESPIILPCFLNNFRSPVENTPAAEGAGASTLRKRSTRPPSRSTQVNIGEETQARQSSSNW